MRFVDRLTGRMPMYRLMTLCLLILAAAALLASALGGIFYPPLALIVSGLVAVGSSWGATRLLGIAFRVRPHDESAVITGLLLFFLFLPTLDPEGLSVLALAGSVASASKFLIVARHRHLFNPAAVAAFLIALTGLGAAGWWVATPVLAPLTAVLALLVLIRTRTLAMGAVFFGVAFVLVVVQLLPFGDSVGSAAAIALGSYPILFLGGFMLTEPQTLPPRRWQRLVVAAVVGVLFALPVGFGFTAGTFYLSSEFALVVGNAVAALLALPRGARLRFSGRSQVAPGVTEFAFTPERPIRVLPGQYVELDLPHARADRRGRRRHLTVVGAADGDLRVAVRTSDPGSSFKRALAELEPGDELRLTTVGGDFVLPADPGVPVLLVAGGIGITPFVRQLEADAVDGVERDVVLVYRASSPAGAAYLERVGRLAGRVLLVTPEPPAEGLPGVHWARSLEEAVAEVDRVRERAVYASGSPAFLDRARIALRTAGARRVKTDLFSGY
jgi:ferredoxin-NADP reductase